MCCFRQSCFVGFYYIRKCLLKMQQVNDRVFFAKYSGTEITYKGDTFLLMDVGDLLARVTN